MSGFILNFVLHKNRAWEYKEAFVNYIVVSNLSNTMKIKKKSMMFVYKFVITGIGNIDLDLGMEDWWSGFTGRLGIVTIFCGG